MAILQSSNFESWKKYWKRRRYQRIDDAAKNRRKMKIERLGSVSSGKSTLKREKSVRLDRPLPMISTTSNEVVDGRMIVEVYKRMVSCRELAALQV